MISVMISNDFIISNYIQILKIAKKNNFIVYDEIINQHRYILWRHDVDCSVHRAYALANIESELSVISTYFFQLGSMYYNIFEQEIRNLVLKIIELGHEIGLHFDPTQYKISNKKEIEKHLRFEKEILENLFGVKISVFSFHNPNVNILNYDEFMYSDMINTYSKYFKENVAYCSDSNGYWRNKRLYDFLNENHSKMQVLTHPVWWQKEVMTPRERIYRCIDGRAVNTINIYDKSLFLLGRENIGKKD